MTAVALATPPEGEVEPKLLLDLKPNECKFPVSESVTARGRQHLFCGKRRFDATTAYCATHLRMMYAEKKPKPVVPPIQR